MSNKITTKANALLLLAVALCQVIFYYSFLHYSIVKGDRLAAKHAEVVAASLWQYDREVLLPYLKLSLSANDYFSIDVVDQSAQAFISLTHPDYSAKQPWFDLHHSLPVLDFQKPIIYKKKHIGDIIIHQSSLSIAVANITFFILISLFSIIIKQYLADRYSQQRLNKYAAQLEKNNHQLEQAAAAAEYANKSKGYFLANMSHEIRTPMNGVLGIIELLRTTALDAKQQQYIRAIQSSSNTLLTVINDILDYSKIESGKLAINLRDVDLYQLIEDSTLTFRDNANEHVEFSYQIAASTPRYIHIDAIRLQQILLNLLSNAFKFTEQGSIKLKISCVSDGASHTLQATIRDTGIGIDEQSLKNLFNPFTQAEQTTNLSYGGTGLGLTICRQLLELMGGDISLQSEIGRGTEFSINLPFKLADNAKRADPATPTVPNNRLTKLNILVVEDNPTNRLITAGFLKRLAITAQTATNGEEAIKTICQQGQAFDIIFMDCEMPITDGFEATRRIRQWEQQQQQAATRICALTAHVMPEHQLKCQQSGMDDYLPKPIAFDQLEVYLQQVASTLASTTKR